MNKEQKKLTVKDMAYIGLMAAVIAVCSMITIPGTVPFTLQTFAVFASLGLLGGKRGTLSVIVYILLGAVGLPVFAGFKGGLGVLFGMTGGYIIGFVASGLIYCAFTALWGNKLPVTVGAMLTGLIACYAIGTAWFMVVYSGTKGSIDLMGALGMCVFPFVIPDLVKTALAVVFDRLLLRRIDPGSTGNAAAA